MARLPAINPKKYTAEQAAVAKAITSGPRGEVRGPFKMLMHNAKATDAVQRMGAYLRFGGTIDGRLRELAILVTARAWSAQYEWYAHAPIAQKEGLADPIIDAIAKNKTPRFKNKDERIVYNFTKELHAKHKVSKANYDAARKLLGNAGIVELIVLCGHYTVVSMVLNAFEVEIPGGKKPLKG
jgi:4-carboxymuconolactone decarboxylase